MTNYTTNLGLSNPVPNDPAVANVWGTLLNGNATQLDSVIAGLLPLNCAGGSNIVLTFTNGVANQTNSAIFNCTGLLTANILVLLPQGKSKVFVAVNNTSGAFTLGFANNNGSGAAAGAVASIPQGGAPCTVMSDGTNCTIISGGLVPGTSYPQIVGGGTVKFSTGGAFTVQIDTTGNTEIQLNPGGPYKVPDITVSSSGPSGSPRGVGSLWVVVP